MNQQYDCMSSGVCTDSRRTIPLPPKNGSYNVRINLNVTGRQHEASSRIVNATQSSATSSHHTTMQQQSYSLPNIQPSRPIPIKVVRIPGSQNTPGTLIKVFDNRQKNLALKTLSQNYEDRNSSAFSPYKPEVQKIWTLNGRDVNVFSPTFQSNHNEPSYYRHTIQESSQDWYKANNLNKLDSINYNNKDISYYQKPIDFNEKYDNLTTLTSTHTYNTVQQRREGILSPILLNRSNPIDLANNWQSSEWRTVRNSTISRSNSIALEEILKIAESKMINKQTWLSLNIVDQGQFWNSNKKEKKISFGIDKYKLIKPPSEFSLTMTRSSIPPPVSSPEKYHLNNSAFIF